MFKWKREYEVGIEVIDEQHKKLFQIGNRAYELHSRFSDIDKYDTIVAIIQELRDYAMFHFETEEKHMLDVKYNNFFSHKVEHTDFIEKINTIDFYNIDDNQERFILKMLEFLLHWITQHIMKSDMGYVKIS